MVEKIQHDRGNKKMTNSMVEYRPWQVRKMRTDLRYRLRQLALSRNTTVEDIINEVIAEGLKICERRSLQQSKLPIFED